MNIIRDRKSRNLLKDYSATGSNLTDTVDFSKAVSITLKENEFLSKHPSHPHFRKCYTFKFHDHKLNWATPDMMFNTNDELKNYFSSVIKSFSLNRIFVPKSPSSFKFEQLRTKFMEIVHSDGNKKNLTPIQKLNFSGILWELSKSINVVTSEYFLKVTDEGELSVYRKGELGMHYIMVGREADEISYVFISRDPGRYVSIHKSDNLTTSQLVEHLISE